MIILTPAQADHVRGLTVKGHALAPRPLANGTFALPEAVLNDPAHAQHKAYLSALPKVEDSTIRAGTKGPNPNDPVTGSDWEQDQAKTMLASYKSEWPEATVIGVDLVAMTTTAPPVEEKM